MLRLPIDGVDPKALGRSESMKESRDETTPFRDCITLQFTKNSRTGCWLRPDCLPFVSRKALYSNVGSFRMWRNQVSWKLILVTRNPISGPTEQSWSMAETKKLKNLNRHDAHLLEANGRTRQRTKEISSELLRTATLVYRSSEIPWKVIRVVQSIVEISSWFVLEKDKMTT